MFSSVRVVGAGLIGTSIALALKSRGKQVEIIDIQPAAQLLAVDLVKGEQISQPDLILIAVPVDVTEEVVLQQISSNPNSLVCDLSSVKSDLQLKVKQLSGNTNKFISLHPMAGRELSGAEGARADLFDGRAWIAIENPEADERAKSIVSELIKICSGTAYWMSATEHDQVVANLSHLPQILSSALAAQLNSISEENLHTAGQGLRDVTRLAKSDAHLWTKILLNNNQSISVALLRFIADLSKLEKDLSSKNERNIKSFLQSGIKGKNRIPGKHGAKDRDYSFLPIVIDDKPGQLAWIFNECAQVNVNVEDLSIEHSPGQETGLITLALSQTDCQKLSLHLIEQGFKVHPAKYR